MCLISPHFVLQLVLLNMADHRLRAGAVAPGAGAGAAAAAAQGSVSAGLVFGMQDTQRVEVTNSTEIAVTTMPDGSITLDTEFLYTQKDLSEFPCVDPVVAQPAISRRLAFT